MDEQIERRSSCVEHLRRTERMEKTLEGNGRKGVVERVAKMEVLMWIVIMLLLSNGGLLAYTLFTIAGLKK